MGLVDADILLYRCAWVAQKRGQEIQPLSFALHAVDTVVESLRSKFGDLKFYLTGSDNFRDKLATIQKYKGSRADKPKPEYYKQAGEFLVEKYHAEIVDGCEADDALGIAQTGGKDTCIISIDKDLLQIPGNHYNWVRDERRFIDEVTGYRNFYEQVLRGDRTDDIPGCAGIGVVKAAKKIRQYSTERAMWQAARYQWNATYPRGIAGLSADEGAKEVATLLWCSRAGRERWSEPT